MSRLIDSARSHTLGDLPRRTADRYPDKLAVLDGARSFTFAEFNVVVNRTANAMGEQGIGHGDRVALLSHNCWEYVVLAYAAARLGAILVPLNFMLGGDEVAWILEHSGAIALVCEDKMHGVAARAIDALASPPRILGWISSDDVVPPDGWAPFTAWTAHPDDREPATRVADDEPLRLMYTSGTESLPKGALLSSRSLIAQYVSCIVDGGMDADDIEVHSLPLYHTGQLDCFLGPDIYLGATSIILPGPDPKDVLSAIERYSATKLFAPPTVWIALMNSPEFPTTDLSTLRKGYYGASPMPVEVLQEMQRRMPDVRLWNVYGQTELAPLATVLKPHEQVAHPGSAGRPVLNVETRIVDDSGHAVGPGVIGEIVHRSPQATLGYFNDPERTAAAFEGGWFHSGDLGTMSADGLLSVVDRKKDMIKTGGENVASREVEEMIYAHPAVSEVAVFGLPDPYWVEAVTAAVVLRDGRTLTEAELINYSRAHLAGFKTPKRVYILDSLPKNPSGKILKRELRERFMREMEMSVG